MHLQRCTYLLTQRKWNSFLIIWSVLSVLLTTLVMWLQVVKIKVTLKEIGAGPGSPLIRLFLSNLNNFGSTSTCGKKNETY